MPVRFRQNATSVMFPFGLPRLCCIDGSVMARCTLKKILTKLMLCAVRHAATCRGKMVCPLLGITRQLVGPLQLPDTHIAAHLVVIRSDRPDIGSGHFYA